MADLIEILGRRVTTEELQALRAVAHVMDDGGGDLPQPAFTARVATETGVSLDVAHYYIEWTLSFIGDAFRSGDLRLDD